jgi:hypothetical protein
VADGCVFVWNTFSRHEKTAVGTLVFSAITSGEAVNGCKGKEVNTRCGIRMKLGRGHEIEDFYAVIANVIWKEFQVWTSECK